MFHFLTSCIKSSKYFTKQILLLTVSLVYLANCERNKENLLIKLEKIDKKDTSEITSFYRKLKKNNLFFNHITTELQNSNIQLIIILSDKVKIAGFKIDSLGNFILNFNSKHDFMKENIIMEEFFHAYQAQFYGHTRFLKIMEGKMKGAANIEFEARLFKSIIAVAQDKTIQETPSQKGLLDFTLRIVNDDGKLESFDFSSSQQKKYIELVCHFQQHWQKRDLEEGCKTLYDNPVDSNMGPEACLHLLKKINSAN